jgi:hypothetical protein
VGSIEGGGEILAQAVMMVVKPANRKISNRGEMLIC